MTGSSTVDVVVPIHGAAAESIACLTSVLDGVTSVPFELVVVDDASPDPELAAHLDDLARRGRITLLRNEVNAGFVASCDRGMTLHPDRDVVLLNSDTLVFDGWLDRLQRVATADPTIGTVTPLSNDATLCSYPVPFALVTTMDPAEAMALDELAAAVNVGAIVDVPTGVGFCLFVRRALLNAVGGFDLEAFGHGYGEENDLCLRAATVGWRNVAATDTFVWHRGSGSFGSRREALVAANRVELLRRWPDYELLIAAHAGADPLSEYRARLDMARIRRGCGDAAILVVLHDLGGGSEVFAQRMITGLRAEGREVLVGRPDPADRSAMRIDWVDGPPTPNVRVPLLGRSPEEIGAQIRSMGIGTARVEQLAGYPEQAPLVFAEAFASAGIPYRVTLHDHAAVCPRIHLTSGAGTYCGEPGPSACQACVDAYGGPWGSVSIPEWRARHGALLRGAERIEAPSRFLAERIGGAHGVEVHVRNHPRVPRAGRPAPQEVLAALPPVAAGRLRVGVIGRIDGLKGFTHLLDLARHVQEHELPVDIVVLGITSDNLAFTDLAAVTITGEYLDDHIDDLVRAARLDVVWFPGVAPETWCFVLDIVLDSGLPIVAFRIGALGERLDADERATLLPIADAFHPARVIDALTDAIRGRPHRR